MGGKPEVLHYRTFFQRLPTIYGLAEKTGKDRCRGRSGGADMLGLITLTIIIILLAIEVVILKGLGALKPKTSFSRPNKGNRSGQTHS